MAHRLVQVQSAKPCLVYQLDLSPLIECRVELEGWISGTRHMPWSGLLRVV